MKLRKLDKNFKIAIMALILTTIAACIFGGLILLMSKTKLKLFNNVIVNDLIIIHVIILTIVPCLVVKKNSGGKFNLELISMKFKENSLSDFFKGMVISLFMFMTLLVTLMTTGIISFKGLGFEFTAVNKVILSVFLALLLATSAGICEEIFFRGILLKYLAKWKGKIFALIASSIIFSVCHITTYKDIKSLTNVFLMGIMLGIIFIVTKSLYMSIGLHFAWDFYLNLFGTEKAPSLFILNSNINYINKVSGWLQIIVKIIIIIILYLYILKEKNLSKEVA